MRKIVLVMIVLLVSQIWSQSFLFKDSPSLGFELEFSNPEFDVFNISNSADEKKSMEMRGIITRAGISDNFEIAAGYWNTASVDLNEIFVGMNYYSSENRKSIFLDISLEYNRLLNKKQRVEVFNEWNMGIRLIKGFRNKKINASLFYLIGGLEYHTRKANDAFISENLLMRAGTSADISGQLEIPLTIPIMRKKDSSILAYLNIRPGLEYRFQSKMTMFFLRLGILTGI